MDELRARCDKFIQVNVSGNLDVTALLAFAQAERAAVWEEVIHEADGEGLPAYFQLWCREQRAKALEATASPGKSSTPS